jgi:dolichol-phosphate mannosyltransferase
MKVSLVIPARNEAGNIDGTLAALRRRLAHAAIDYEILVVDDGSSDGTADRVRAHGREDPRVRVLVNEGRHGFGYAVRFGLDHYLGDAVVIVMADGSDEPDDVVAYARVLEQQAECAFGSRWIAGSAVHAYPRFKYFVNRLTNQAIRLLFGIKYNDVTNAFKGYRRNVIDGCRPFLSPHFNLTVEIPLKAIVRGYSYEVIPISWRGREVGESALKLQEMGSRYLFIVLNVWLEKMLTRGDYRRSDARAGSELKVADDDEAQAVRMKGAAQHK